MGCKTHRYYKHTKFCQNPRGDLVDLTWNDPYDIACMAGTNAEKTQMIISDITVDSHHTSFSILPACRTGTHASTT